MKQGEHRWDKDKRCDGGAEQATDDRASQRRVLLAAIAKAKRHRHHADDHGERCHDDWPEPCGAGLKGSINGVTVD